MRSDIARALAKAVIPVPGGYANDLAELEALRVVCFEGDAGGRGFICGFISSG